MSLAKEFLEKVSEYLPEEKVEQDDDGVKCPECGATKVEVDGNECTCEECGAKWKTKSDEDEDEE
jgi:hypothetical protein